MDTLTSLFLRNRFYLCRIAFNILHDSEDVKDIVQDTFCRLWEKREQIREVGDLKWLMVQTVRRLCIDHLRRRRTVERILNQIQMGEIDVVPESQPTDIAPKALSYITGDRKRQIMSKLFQEGKSQEDTAKEMGVTLQYVRNVSHEAVKVLREKLTNGR